MSLSKTEKNLDAVLDALQHKKIAERARAISRLNHLDLWAKSSDIERIMGALTEAQNKETNKIGKGKIGKLLEKYTVYLNSTEEEKARIIKEIKLKKQEKRKLEEDKIKAEKHKKELEEKAEKHKKELEEKARLDAIKLREEQERIAREKVILENNRIMEEENEREDFTYLSRDSSRRFPTHIFYMNTLIPILIVLTIISGAIGFVGGVDSVGIGFALVVLIWTFVGALFLLLGREIIRLILDFHDNNHVNTKIRIETLNALKEINKNLEKKN